MGGIKYKSHVGGCSVLDSNLMQHCVDKHTVCFVLMFGLHGWTTPGAPVMYQGTQGFVFQAKFLFVSYLSLPI